MTRRWDFIPAHRADFGVKRLRRMLQVSRSGFYRHLASAESRAAGRRDDEELVTEIHSSHKGTYGVRRVHAELRGFGHTVNRKNDAPEALLDDAPGEAGDLRVAHVLQRPQTPQRPQLPLTRGVRTATPANS